MTSRIRTATFGLFAAGSSHFGAHSGILPKILSKDFRSHPRKDAGFNRKKQTVLSRLRDLILKTVS